MCFIKCQEHEPPKKPKGSDEEKLKTNLTKMYRSPSLWEASLGSLLIDKANGSPGRPDYPTYNHYSPSTLMTTPFPFSYLTQNFCLF